MPTVTVHFGGICTFFMAGFHAELDGFCRAVLVNAAKAQMIDDQEIPAHVAKVQIGGEPAVTVQGLKMSLHTSRTDLPLLTVFAERCPNLTLLTLEQDEAVLSRPSQEVVFGGDRDKTALYFDFKGGTLEPTLNDLGAVVTTLVMQGDEVVLETSAFSGAPEPPESLAGRVFTEDTTIWVSNDDTTDHTSKYDFYLHYLTAEQMPAKPAIPKEPPSNLPVVHRLPHWFGAIGAGCSNSTYP